MSRRDPRHRGTALGRISNLFGDMWVSRRMWQEARFHVSMVLRSDQPASRTLFAMLVRASFDGLTLPMPHKLRCFLVQKNLPVAYSAWIAFTRWPLRALCKVASFASLARKYVDLLAGGQRRQRFGAEVYADPHIDGLCRFRYLDRHGGGGSIRAAEHHPRGGEHRSETPGMLA
jgi:hypothetical protein